MEENEHVHSHDETAFEDETRKQLEVMFSQLPGPVPVALFTRDGDNDAYNQAARKFLRALADLSDKVQLTEFGIGHEWVVKHKVDTSPSILFDPERIDLRIQGAPLGEEGRTFIEALILTGMRQSGLSEQSKKVLRELDSQREVIVFVSPSCPYCPQQAVNAVRAALERPELVSVRIIDIQANPDLAKVYSAFSVPQAYANDILIAEGAQTEELFAASLLKMEQQTIFIPDNDAELIECDLVIVGGGPAGLTAGIYAERSGLKSVVVERDALGGQVSTTPVVENYPGLKKVAGKTLVDIMVAHALEYCQIFQGEEVLDVRPGVAIEVVTSRRKFRTRAVLLATGASYRKLGVPGENRLSGHGVSYCATCDGPLFRGKRVIMVGGGNGAVTEALHLANIGVEVTLIHRRETLRAQKHLADLLVQQQVPVLWNTRVEEIRGKGQVEDVMLVNSKTGEKKNQKTDGVFVAIGSEPGVGLARKIGVKLTGDGFIERDERHRTSMPGVYSAGDVEGGYRQIVTAVGQGAEAAMSLFEDLMNPYWVKARQESAKSG